MSSRVGPRYNKEHDMRTYYKARLVELEVFPIVDREAIVPQEEEQQRAFSVVVLVIEIDPPHSPCD